MEDYPYPEDEWTINDSVDLNTPEGPIYLKWDNTIIHRYEYGDGLYDYVDHTKPDETHYIFFLKSENTEGLSEILFQYNFPYQWSPYVEEGVIRSRIINDADPEVREFAEQLSEIVSTQDFYDRFPVKND